MCRELINELTACVHATVVCAVERPRSRADRVGQNKAFMKDLERPLG